MNKHNHKVLSLFVLVMLMTGAVDSIRNLPATALFGSSLIFFFIFSAITFLIPTALVSAELSTLSSAQNGIYFWVTKGLGKKFGFIAVWLQWINTMVWFPTILSFIAATVAYLFKPELANDPKYLIITTLGFFWFLTWLNLKGIKISGKTASICTVLGMVIPLALIVILAIGWLVSGNPAHIHITSTNFFPSLHHTDNWISLTAIITSFAGMELATVHVNAVKNPQKIFPKALSLAVMLIGATMLCGAFAIAIVLPGDQINLVNGVMQAFQAFFAHFHIQWLMPIITVMIVLGSFGGMVSWVISPAKGLLQATQQGFLPQFLAKENAYHVPHILLIIQAILVSVICLAFLLMPSVNASYWLLSDLSTQVYLLMYFLMLATAIVLKRNAIINVIPGKKCGFWLAILLGIVGCSIAFLVGFIPPSNMDTGGAWHYEVMFTAGILLMILPAGIVCGYHAFKDRTMQLEVPALNT